MDTSPYKRPLRSWLFTPATRPDRFDKAAAVGADVLILDLEDSVAPADKDSARRTALQYLGRSEGGGPARALRVNGLGTAAGNADLQALLASNAVPDFLVLPKTERALQLQPLQRQLFAVGKRSRFIALIESAAGLATVEEIAAASPRLTGLMFGAGDMAADLGAATAWEPLLYARSRLIAACARSGVLAIDAPFFDVRDRTGLEQEIARSSALGFTAKAAIHPGQVAAIHAALTPSAEAIAEARAILAENAKGVGTVNGRMVDEAIARKARRVLAAIGEAA